VFALVLPGVPTVAAAMPAIAARSRAIYVLDPNAVAALIEPAASAVK
jgi:hypothetical protein